MQAKSRVELLNFEGNIESAFAKWLEERKIEVFTSHDQRTLPDYHIGVTVNIGSATDHVYEIQPGVLEYDQYEFQLVLTVKTLRHTEEGPDIQGAKSKNQELIAMLRKWLSPSMAKESNLNQYLKYYEIQFLMPSGTTYDEDEEFDQTAIVFSGQFSILPNAWI